jgi:hypothetical protein
VGSYDLADFAKENFRPAKKKAILREQELSYAKKCISTSLLPLSDELSKHAVEMFRNILTYTAKKAPAKPEAVFKAIWKLSLKDENMRDELFCQLIKQQLGKLPSEACRVKIWELFTFCCACTRPSGVLEPYILNHW